MLFKGINNDGMFGGKEPVTSIIDVSTQCPLATNQDVFALICESISVASQTVTTIDRIGPPCLIYFVRSDAISTLKPCDIL